MDAPLDGLALAAQLDRLVAEARQRHRLLFLERLSDEAFAPWARAKAIDNPDDVAHLHLFADERSVVSGIVAGYEVHGEALDDALQTVLTGRSLVLVAGLDKARLWLSDALLPWLDWAAAELPLTVACTRNAGVFLPHLRHRAVAVHQVVHHAPRKEP